MASNLSSSQQSATSPCWTQLNDLLRTRLGWLHHSLGCDDLSPVEAAEQFSNFVSDLLQEYGVVKSSSGSGRHRPRRIEVAVQNLSLMKNNSRKGPSHSNELLHLVRAHNKVLKCYRSDQNNKNICKNEKDFRHNPWEYARKKLLPSDNVSPLFDCNTASTFFTQTYSDSSLNYGVHLPTWVIDRIPDCDTSLFNTERITPSLIKSYLRHCSMKSAPGPDGLTYYHLFHLPCTHHFLATLFNKILTVGTAPGSWGQAHIKLIYKAGDRHALQISAQLPLHLLLANCYIRFLVEGWSLF